MREQGLAAHQRRLVGSPVVADAGTDNYSYRYVRVQGAVAF